MTWEVRHQEYTAPPGTVRIARIDSLQRGRMTFEQARRPARCWPWHGLDAAPGGPPSRHVRPGSTSGGISMRSNKLLPGLFASKNLGGCRRVEFTRLDGSRASLDISVCDVWQHGGETLIGSPSGIYVLARCSLLMLDSRFRHLWRRSRNFGASRLIVVEIDDREVHAWFKRQEAEQRSDEFDPSSHEAEVPEVEPASKALPGTKSEDVGLPDLVTLDEPPVWSVDERARASGPRASYPSRPSKGAGEGLTCTMADPPPLARIDVWYRASRDVPRQPRG